MMGWEIRAWRRVDGPELLRMLRVWGGRGGGVRKGPPTHRHRGGPPLNFVSPLSRNGRNWRGGPGLRVRRVRAPNHVTPPKPMTFDPPSS